MPSVYILLTKTNSTFSRAIASRTKETYVHASIITSKHLEYGYSFSRRKIKNPIFGGFVREEYSKWVEYFKDVQCCIYELEVTKDQYKKIKDIIRTFDEEKEKYKYHFLGVVGQSFRIDIERKNRFFCTQFVAYVLTEAGALELDKLPIHTRSEDFKNHERLTLVYEGPLEPVLYNVIKEIPHNKLKTKERLCRQANAVNLYNSL